MRRIHLYLAFLVLALWLPAQLDGQTKTAKRSTPPPAPAKRSTLTIKEIMQRESAAIVAITNLDERGEARKTGTGFIVMAEGVILTNYHVIDGARDARIKLKNGEVYDRVQVIDYDKRRDIAVLQIRATGLPMVTLGDPSTVDVGDDAIAIGNPNGLEHTVSNGVISAKRTDVPGLEGTAVFQTTAPISPGSSGGPLYNNRGEVIGITTAQFRSEGAQNLNFAVDLKYAMLMFGHGPGMNLSLADVAAKENPAPAREERRQSAASQPPPQEQPASGSKAPSATGNRYTEPTGYASIDLQPGWRVEQSDVKNRIMTLVNGRSTVWVYRAESKDAAELFKIWYDAFKQNFAEMTTDGQLVETTLPGGPVKAQWFLMKAKDGSKIRALIGALVTSKGGMVYVGTMSETNTEDRGPISTMFVTLQ